MEVDGIAAVLLELAESARRSIKVGGIRRADSYCIHLEIPMAARDSSGRCARCPKRAVMREPSKDVRRLCELASKVAVI